MKQTVTNRKKQIAMVMAMVLLLLNINITVSAAKTTADGNYTVAVTAKKTGTDSASMLDSYLYKTADLIIADGKGTLHFYVKKYYSLGIECLEFIADKNKKLEKTDEAAVIDGEVYDAYKYELKDLDTESYEMESKIIIMGMDVNFELVIDWKKQVEGSTEFLPDNSESKEESRQEVSISAEVEETNEASYQVTIPASIGLGTLSKTENSATEYEVYVEISGFFDGSFVTVSAPATGTLKKNTSIISFTNDFGTQKFTKSTAKKAKIQVKAEEVQQAEAGNYVGTTVFTIQYKK